MTGTGPAPAWSGRRPRVFARGCVSPDGAAAGSGFLPLAISTVNGSPLLRAPVVILTSSRPASARRRARRWSLKPERLVAEAVTNPYLGVFAQIEHQHATARHEDADRLTHRHDRVVGVVQRL